MGKGSRRDQAAPRVARRKLTNKEQRELESLPARIEALEKEQAELTVTLANPPGKAERSAWSDARARFEACEREHAEAFARWEELEAARAKS